MASNGFLQLGTVDVLVSTFHNFTGSDIAAGLAVLVDAAHPPTGDFAGGVVLPTATGGVVGTIGVTVETLKAGRSGPVRLSGISVCLANGTIAFGASVQVSDTALKLGWVKTQIAATVSLGWALAPAENGDLVPVFHQLSNNA